MLRANTLFLNFSQDPEGAKKALELDSIEIKGKPIKVFASLEDWDQHIANFKDAQKNQEAEAGAKEGEEGEAEEGEGEGEFEEGDEGANGDAEMDDTQVSFSSSTMPFFSLVCFNNF